jgi:signal transduction histidine kinase
LLRPSTLDDFGLDTSLGWLADGFSQRTGIKVDYVSSGVQRTDGESETQLFRIAQEALTNVARHANATLVRMELQRSGNALVLTVSDNGMGLPDTKTGTGLGLVGMRARSRAANGTLTVSSCPGKGVTIKAEILVKGDVDVAQNSHHTGG